ncbi:SAM and HD domain containing deoxynucleoside triphosphate triphosphohydrolase falten isoform 2-T5 [Cochliomyia hominivorax]
MEIIDVIYGKFTIPKDIAAIVETPQFQRLKFIKQLGFFRLPNNIEHKHNRYEHCLGTYHAASKMLDALEQNTEWIRKNNNNIPLTYRKAVQVAALLHDIAHGPFSHAWENVVSNYVHETEAFPCIDHIFQQIDKDLFPELRHNNNFGINLIKALIEGYIDKFKHKDDLPQQYRFIFEIVANKRLKFDVDKWDYLKRDYFYLKHVYAPNMDFDDVFLKARVSNCGTQIEYRYEDYDKIYNLCAARYYFHIHCYSLPQFLLCDYILNLAIKEIKPKINNILVTDIRAKYMTEFLQFTDENILKLIESSAYNKFLQNNSIFKEVNQLPSKEATIATTVKTESLRKYMPSISDISFYGDMKNLPALNDNTENVQKIYTCYCDQSTNIVYYTVQYN